MFLVVLLSSDSHEAFASTSLNGVNISSDTTWDLAGSPYILGGIVTLLPNINLTIDPGVVVKFSDPFSRLEVYGNLNANGTASQKIYFTGINDNSEEVTGVVGGVDNGAPGDWRRLAFLDDSISSLTSHYYKIWG